MNVRKHKSFKGIMEANTEQAEAKLANGIFKEPIDYVLVHSKNESDENKLSRERFEEALEKENISIKSEDIDIGGEAKVFKKLHCDFERLCEEAERVKLEMPLEGCEMSTLEPCRNIKKKFESDNEADYKNISISAPFKVEKRDKFKGHENKETFFRPALRALLVHSILINIYISEKEVEKGSSPTTADAETTKEHHGFKDTCWFWPWSCQRASSDESSHQKGLKSLIEEEVYEDGYILHEDSSISLESKIICKKDKRESLETDPRKDMDDNWWTLKFWKFQPLWKIRNYFGEKIALYFAWAGLLLTTLLMPALLGLACFIYGLFISVARLNEDNQMPANLTVQDEFRLQLRSLIEFIRGLFDNDVTPWFTFVTCLWGTIFLELWKRKNAVLAYKWHVVNYEDNEQDRPKIFKQELTVSQLDKCKSRIKQCCMAFPIWIPPLIVVLFMGLISVLACAWLRLFIFIEYCGDTPTIKCSLSSFIIPGISNAVFIIIMGSIYNCIAEKLTNCEDHDTQTEYDDALILKLFAFQFANNFASCFYIAFFRGEFDVFGLLGFGEEYSDVCYGGSCMSQLSIQVFILMISKPIGKFFKDIIWPPFKDIVWSAMHDTIWKKIKYAVTGIEPSCAKCDVTKDSSIKKQIQYAVTGIEPPCGIYGVTKDSSIQSSIQRNYSKVRLEDFTLEEYLEKVNLYGFLMLFAAALPLAPLIAVIWLAADMALDVQRLLWLTRRPIAVIAQDIGSWYDILNFVNVLGVISNGFLIAFKSQWGLQYDFTTRMWICIGFQNTVFAIKFFLDYIIPDVPKEVTRAIRRDKSTVSRKMKEKSSNKNGHETHPDINGADTKEVTSVRKIEEVIITQLSNNPPPRAIKKNTIQTQTFYIKNESSKGKYNGYGKSSRRTKKQNKDSNRRNLAKAAKMLKENKILPVKKQRSPPRSADSPNCRGYESEKQRIASGLFTSWDDETQC